MGEIFDKANGQPDHPHRHDYFTVLVIIAAEGDHIIDYQSYPFSKKEVHFVGPGQVHQVLLDRKPDGWFFTFSREFLVENDIPESFISNINLFKPFGDTPPLKIDDKGFERLINIVNEMKTCLPMNFKYRNRALGALLQLFLVYCNNSTSLNPSQLDEDKASVCILRDFKSLVDRRFVEWHKVGQYAAEIHITPKHLSETVKDITGKPAKAIIQDRLLLEAKRLLYHTNLSVKEVAYKIGFEEPLHFSGFFKKKAGVSPTQFRSNVNR
ncbi:MAG: helix-turn-helix domain-containing protein [Bacteroidota bacterium]